MEAILDFTKPLDVALLDEAVNQLYSQGAPPEVQRVLVAFQDDPRAWTRVDSILQRSQLPATKMLALNILGDCIRRRWRILPPEQREGIKGFLVSMIISFSKESALLAANRPLVSKLNLTLVQVLKQTWPHEWPTFMQELVQSSRASESVCANNMSILRLLSEEIFDFSASQMTQDKIRQMKESLNKEFALVFQLCEYVLQNSQDHALLSSTLRTLDRFLHWIPVGFIFETNLIETLALKFFPADAFQNDALKCLAEIGSLKLRDHPEYNPTFVQLFAAVTTHVQGLLTPSTDVAQIYSTGNARAQAFVRYLTLFLSGFLKAHLALLEDGGAESRQVLFVSLSFLMRMSRVDDTEIFKICLEYWNALVSDLYRSQRGLMGGGAAGGVGVGAAAGVSAAGRLGAAVASGTKAGMSPRVAMYAEVLHELRLVLIAKMAKPEEVLIVENENGEFVREVGKNTDAIILYKSMRECLVYLTHLDPVDTQETMLLKLQRQCDGSEWSHANLNSLCWAIGSISGALLEPAEKTFLVRVIKDLLGLVEQKRTKTNKAVIASNIMYVVGQYPRFLRVHWKFLKTVILKLFEFMHEDHPGVQDMSCETFVKIAQKCHKNFVRTQPDEPRPFIENILDRLPHTIRDLPEHNQVLLFYTACGTIIRAQQDPERRQALIARLMALPNQAWGQITAQAGRSVEALWETATVKQVVYVLKVNNVVAQAVGHGYSVQLSRMFVEMLQIYCLYSDYIAKLVRAKGEVMTGAAIVRSMRQVKKEVLNLMRCFVRESQQSDTPMVLKTFLPSLVPAVLGDYREGVPDSRDAEVLRLFTEVIEKYGEGVTEYLPSVFESCFQSTLSMITANFSDNPDHRLHFFALIRAINRRCFRALLALNQEQFKLIVDSIVWAFKHLHRDIADTGLLVLLEMLENVQQSDVANLFYKSYLILLLNDILAVLTDTLHKSGLQLHAQILARMFKIVDSGTITVPLWDGAGGGRQYPNNSTYVREVVLELLTKAFANMSAAQLNQFVAGLFRLHDDMDAFKAHLRDFLVQCKEFAGGDDNQELFAEERENQRLAAAARERASVAQVPGLQYEGRGGGGGGGGGGGVAGAGAGVGGSTMN